MGNPVFVTGPPRTGTTVTAWLLNWHPHCAILPTEDHWWVDWIGSLIRPIENVKTPTWEDLLEAHLRLYGLPPEGVFGLLSPRWLLCWRLLRSWFPDCSFVVTTRDEQATMDSVIRQGWALTETEARVSLAQHFDALDDIPVISTVCLEMLQHDPGSYLKCILRDLDLDPDLYPWKEALTAMRERTIS